MSNLKLYINKPKVTDGVGKIFSFKHADVQQTNIAVGIREAVSLECRSEEVQYALAAAEEVRRLTDILGVMTQLLYDKGVLSKEEILALLPSFRSEA